MSVHSSLFCLTPSQLLWLLQHNKIYIKRHVSALFPVLSDTKLAAMAPTAQQNIHKETITCKCTLPCPV